MIYKTMLIAYMFPKRILYNFPEGGTRVLRTWV